MPVCSFCQEIQISNSARTAGLGGCSISISDSWSVINNQAGLGSQRSYWAGIYHENKYLVKELGYSVLAACIPVKPGTFGISLTHFGYSQYSQSRFALSYGMKLSSNIYAGVGLNYHTLKLANEYGSASCISVEGGIIYNPIEKLTLGAHIINPTQSTFGSSKKLPTSFGLSLAYKPNRNIILIVQGDDNTQYKTVFRTGIEYNPIKRVSIRTGIASNPTEVSFGLGWRVKHMVFDLAFSYHQILGYTPFASLSYTFSDSAKSQDKTIQ